MTRKDAEKWFEIADKDLASADILVKRKLFETSLFHCQQAAEKYIKGFLTSRGKQFPKIHDIVYLVKIAEKEDNVFKEILEDAAGLTDFAVMYRYPLDKKIILTVSDCKRALKRVRAIKHFILKKINA